MYVKNAALQTYCMIQGTSAYCLICNLIPTPIIDRNLHTKSKQERWIIPVARREVGVCEKVHGWVWRVDVATRTSPISLTYAVIPVLDGERTIFVFFWQHVE